MAYSQGAVAVAVGELAGIVADDGDQLGLPIAALAEAYGRAKPGEEQLIAVLAAGVAAVQILSLDPADARQVGVLSRLGTLGMAHAAVATMANDAYVVTAEGELMRRLIADWLVIDI